MTTDRGATSLDIRTAAAFARHGALAAALLAGTALVAGPAAAQSAGAGAGRIVIAELPPLPGGPVCMKDRDWLVVEAEQFISRTTARAEDLQKKVIEQELAAERDPGAGKTAEMMRADLRETLRRVRDAQGYREDARRLTTRECLIREGQGLEVRNAAASVSGAATASLPHASEPMIDVRLTQAQACRKDAECEISLVSETHRPATDDRRVAVMIDLPANAGTFLRASDAWNCYAMQGGAVCLAKLAQLKPGAPVEAKLTWRLQAGLGDTEARFCTRTPKTTADGRPTSDPDRMRVLQAVLADYGYRSGAIDGRFADGTRIVLASAAPDFGIERSGDDDRIAAALLGSTVSRVGVTTGPCLQLALAPSATRNDAGPVVSVAPVTSATTTATTPATIVTPNPVALTTPATVTTPVPVALAPVPTVTQPVTTNTAAPPPVANVQPTDSGADGKAPAKGKKGVVAKLTDDDGQSQPAKAKVQPVKEKTTTVVKPKTPRAEETTPARKVVVRRVNEEAAPPPVARRVAPAPAAAPPPPPQPQYSGPPISIGIGLGRRGGFGIGF
ncbi:hypothetical protein C2U72_19490 [Prosthecomicrobium hirschii]|uniref:hypothetical protein n=1 Tax=Prosthecodimorpha hirschii TaxID=665126 RepID=UPI0011276B6D|nr:hypothetical protein [Prosthecomicrobium hirschii]TPQ49262.1 hypothetical protein C2U72_19490 [Prosthecomicrobium hirschii]